MSVSNTAKRLYRTLSSHVNSSFLDDGSTHGVNSNMIAVVPSSGIVDSPRVNRKFSGSIRLSSRLTATNRDGENEEDITTSPALQGIQRDNKYPVVSFIVVYTMIFFNGCCFTAVVPSVPFYLQILSAPPSFLGWVVSFYSLGQIFGSPLAGWLTSQLTSRRILTISSTLGLLSSTLYATAPAYMFILISRLLTGISAGMEFTTELTFIAKNTTTKERTTYLASVTAVNVVGFIMGPALGTVLATLDIELWGLKIDQYTGPGWLLAFMFLVDLCMVQGLFEDHELVLGDDEGEDDEDHQEEKPEETKALLKNNGKNNYGTPSIANHKENGSFENNKDEPPPSLSLVLGLIFVQFTVMCGFSVLETITSPLAQDNFDWDVQECNFLFTGGGFVSLAAYVIFVIASKWVQDRWLIVYALVLCFSGFVLAVDWSQLSFIPPWVSAMLPPYLNRFLGGYMVMNAGFMTGRPVTFALYSKLIPSQYQGKYLGWMVAGGSAARTLGPFAAVALYYGFANSSGLNLLALFGTVGIFHLLCLLYVAMEWPKLLPDRTTSTSSRDERKIDIDDDTASREEEGGGMMVNYDTHSSSGSSTESA